MRGPSEQINNRMCVWAGTKNAIEKRKALWFELGEVITGFETDETVCLMGHLNAQICDAKINEVIGKFGVEGVNKNGELMKEMWLLNEMASAEPRRAQI